jgi:asparagine synthase (glutamine-hydrolysing)
LALPLADHYDAANETRYLRAKAQVMALFPETMRSALPRHKQIYRAALATAVAGTGGAPCAVEIGLLDERALARETDTATRMMVAAVEQWLVGAVTAGITVSS